MKKLMIIAATAAMAFAAQAELNLDWQQCPDCAPGDAYTKCDTEVFKVTASGKAVVMSKKGYKEIGKLKVKKGALALAGTMCPNGKCCYDTGVLFATVKAGHDTFEAAIPVNVKVWSVFGKNYEKVRGNKWRNLKKAKKFKLDSAIYISAQGLITEDDTDLDSYGYQNANQDFVLEASAFGKAQFRVYDKKTSKTVCGDDTLNCTYDIMLKDYSGWFVGYVPCIDEDSCFTCLCGWDPFGGTWKAKYSKKHTGDVSGAQQLAGTSFSVTVDPVENAGDVGAITVDDSAATVILASPYAN